jgi:hypothetical protein
VVVAAASKITVLMCQTKLLLFKSRGGLLILDG